MPRTALLASSKADFLNSGMGKSNSLTTEDAEEHRENHEQMWGGSGRNRILLGLEQTASA
jgi:hypothetical protein